MATVKIVDTITLFKVTMGIREATAIHAALVNADAAFVKKWISKPAYDKLYELFANIACKYPPGMV